MLQMGIVDGLVLSAVMAILLLTILRINPEVMLNDYPPDVRAKFGPMSATAKRQRVFWSLIMFAAIIGVMVWSFQRLDTAVGDMQFRDAFVHMLIVFLVFNVVDLVLIDWIMVWTQPRFIVLPGTEGLAGYRDYFFHFRAFLIGVAMIVPMSAIVAAIVARFM